MGITSIANLTPLPSPRAIEPDIEPLPMARVENSTRTGDGTYSPSNGKSARGAEDDESEEPLEDLPGDAESESTTAVTSPNAESQISFFA